MVVFSVAGCVCADSASSSVSSACVIFCFVFVALNTTSTTTTTTTTTTNYRTTTAITTSSVGLFNLVRSRVWVGWCLGCCCHVFVSYCNFNQVLGVVVGVRCNDTSSRSSSCSSCSSSICEVL